MMLGVWIIGWILLSSVQGVIKDTGPVGRLKRTKIIEISNDEGQNGLDNEKASTRLEFTSKYGGTKTLDLSISCGMNELVLNFNTSSNFTGVMYALDSYKECIGEYKNVHPTFVYKIPLKGCNTKTEFKETGIEYVNTVVIQRHTKLTGPGARRVSVRCRYPNLVQTVHTNIRSRFNVSDNADHTLFNTSSPPKVFLQVYSGNLSSNVPAMNVHVGQNLTMVIGIEEQDTYFIKVSNCSVRSGLGNIQQLYDFNGCPVDNEIMGSLTYSENRNFAFVTFGAHKFPVNSAVIYQCAVKFCHHDNDVCGPLPPICPGTNSTGTVMSNAEFYKTFGQRNISKNAFIDVVPETSNPPSEHLMEFGNLADGPISGGLTPEMIEKIFYKQEKDHICIGKPNQRVRRRVISEIKTNKTVQLEYGMRVVDGAEKPPSSPVLDPDFPKREERDCYKEAKIYEVTFVVFVMCLITSIGGLLYMSHEYLSDTCKTSPTAANRQESSESGPHSPRREETNRSRSQADINNSAVSQRREEINRSRSQADINNSAVSQRREETNRSRSQADINNSAVSQRREENNRSRSQADINNSAISQRREEINRSRNQADINNSAISQRREEINRSRNQADINNSAISHRREENNRSRSQADINNMAISLRREENNRSRSRADINNLAISQRREEFNRSRSQVDINNLALSQWQPTGPNRRPNGANMMRARRHHRSSSGEFYPQCCTQGIAGRKVVVRSGTAECSF